MAFWVGAFLFACVTVPCMIVGMLAAFIWCGLCAGFEGASKFVAAFKDDPS